ncbi:CinA-like protein [uncultured Desulfatiglans sp.]|uniref:CinA-like protein n=1 Tax=Uncultured Desulfatiglans sp. TaxID=1748965 RepID=A0A653A4Y8_UNCDX|nr:CinA-like protein [uncultured Desulfatiglans sp.]
MYGEIITIGTELISGRTLDLNAWYAAGRLTASGLRVTRMTAVGDDRERVTDALSRALGESLFVIVTGGLGSTEDDMTTAIVADALKRPLCLDRRMFDLIKSHAEARGMEMTAALEKMAWMPGGAQVLKPEGNACGFRMVEGAVRLYFLPGVPDQMRYLMDECVLPDLLQRFQTLPVLRQRILKLYGVSEPVIAETFKSLEAKSPDVQFGFYPRFPENHITISLRGPDEPSVSRELDQAESAVRGLLGEYVFSAGSDTMEEVVGRGLIEAGLKLASAESCTGGMIGQMLTNVPGSSDYFEGGVISYSNAAKVDFLGVRRRTLERHGAVSRETALEMAEGVRGRMHVDIGLSVTGIAGPAGGSAEKPVGTVYFGLAHERASFAERYRFWGTRKQIRKNAAMMALDWVRRFLHGDPFLSGV